MFRYLRKYVPTARQATRPFRIRVLGKDNDCYLGLINAVLVLPHTRKRWPNEHVNDVPHSDDSALRMEINYVNVTIQLPSCRKTYFSCLLSSEIPFFLKLIQAASAQYAG